MMSENTRDVLAKAERQINEARRKGEDEIRAGDRAQRERLERASPSGARRSFVDLLNGQSDQRASRELPGAIALDGIRKQQELGRRTPQEHNRVHDRLAKSGAFDAFIARNATPVGAGASYGEARLPERRVAGPRGNFDFRPGEPGNNLGSRFEWSDEFVPPEGVGRVPDARGRVRGDDVGGRHFSDGEPESVIADLKWLLSATRALIAAVNSREYARNRV